ncbi:cytochrome-c peroxidase [Pelistega suis]|uniref:Methylamine utilization protein MauG n=1 Tax=Pelistega suis TaxID=1631957 RepID=A0A849P6K1_9BURK|nr:cytochrome c peroxidase [Pelistega suis]NOL52221.1 methylamine utilization protein MauG [Pelistega suis]
MFKNKIIVLTFFSLLSSSISASHIDKATLGQALFFDTRLSLNNKQSCASCHNPQHAFIDDRENSRFRMVSEGADGHSFGNRNTPTAMYSAFHSALSYDTKRQTFKGGLFWDGRAKDLADQAGQPPLNPVEMQMPNKHAVIERLSQIDFYQENFKKLYGSDIWENVDKAYQAMGDAIMAFEKTKEFAPFDSKYDRYLRGEYELTPLEDLGRTLFFSNNNVNCKTCHSLKPEDSEGEVFTNFEHHNIGVPRNLKLMVLNQLDKNFKDQGSLENPTIKGDTKQAGKFKTPTLRNVAITEPYMHNGVFKDLRTVILFYDKFNNPERKINPETGEPWGEAEVPETVNLTDLRANALSDRKVDALEAFLKTLTDRRYEHLLK